MKSQKQTMSQPQASEGRGTLGFQPMRHVIGVCVAALLSACGGVDDGSIGSEGEITLRSGSQTVVPGTIDTTQNLLKTISWQVNQITPNSPALLLGNADCAVAAKTDRIYPAPSNSTDTFVHGGSTWSCALTVTSVTPVGEDHLYELLLTAKDELGRNITYSKTLRVAPGV